MIWGYPHFRQPPYISMIFNSSHGLRWFLFHSRLPGGYFRHHFLSFRWPRWLRAANRAGFWVLWNLWASARRETETKCFTERIIFLIDGRNFKGASDRAQCHSLDVSVWDELCKSWWTADVFRSGILPRLSRWWPTFSRWVRWLFGIPWDSYQNNGLPFWRGSLGQISSNDTQQSQLGAGVLGTGYRGFGVGKELHRTMVPWTRSMAPTAAIVWRDSTSWCRTSALRRAILNPGRGVLSSCYTWIASSKFCRPSDILQMLNDWSEPIPQPLPLDSVTNLSSETVRR